MDLLVDGEDDARLQLRFSRTAIGSYPRVVKLKLSDYDRERPTLSSSKHGIVLTIDALS